MNEFIKQKADEYINDINEKMEKQVGRPLTSNEEYLIRIGMGYGIALSGLSLNSLPVDITLTEE